MSELRGDDGSKELLQSNTAQAKLFEKREMYSIGTKCPAKEAPQERDRRQLLG